MPSNSESPVKRTRKSKGKSKNGCLTCRKRRIKCDEVRPRCTRCETHPHACVYPLDERPEWKSRIETFSLLLPRKTLIRSVQKSLKPPASRILRPPTPSRSHSPLPYSVSIIPEEQRGSFGPKDTYLLDNFIFKTSHTLILPHHLWVEEILQLAFCNDHLLHAIMSISARHLRKVQPPSTSYSNEDHELLGAQHLQQSLSAYQSCLSSFDCQSNKSAMAIHEAMFATSMILKFSSFSDLDFNPSPSFRCVDSSFGLRRGLCSFTTHPRQYYEGSWLYNIDHSVSYFYPDSMSREASRSSWPGEKLLRHVDEFQCMSPGDRVVCKDIVATLLPYLIESLSEYKTSEAVDKLLVSFQKWLSRCPRALDPLMDAFHPVALVILAHFYAGVELMVAQSPIKWWWWKEKPAYMVTTITTYLGPSWDDWMEWPRIVHERALKTCSNAGEAAFA